MESTLFLVSTWIVGTILVVLIILFIGGAIILSIISSIIYGISKLIRSKE